MLNNFCDFLVQLTNDFILFLDPFILLLHLTYKISNTIVSGSFIFWNIIQALGALQEYFWAGIIMLLPISSHELICAAIRRALNFDSMTIILKMLLQLFVGNLADLAAINRATLKLCFI